MKGTEKGDIIARIRAEMDRVVIGKEDIKELLLLTLLCEGHLLIEGRQGTAKTTLSRTFAEIIGGEFKRIQGTPDMLPADITGFYRHNSAGESPFVPGPIFANVVLADELNRTTPRTQSALLEAMQERQVTVETVTHALPAPFMVVAAQMASGSIGTSPLSEVQVDRFMFRAWSEYPGETEEDGVLREIDTIGEYRLSPVVDTDAISGLQRAVKEVHVADGIRGYIIAIINGLRHHPDLAIGPSPRGSIALLKGSRALAFSDGRDFVLPDDIKHLVIPAVYHRCHLEAEAEMEGLSLDNIITQVVAAMPVPVE